MADLALKLPVELQFPEWRGTFAAERETQLITSRLHIIRHTTYLRYTSLGDKFVIWKVLNSS